MKKIALNFWIVLVVLITSNTIAQPANAYLVPLIGGIGMLLATVVGIVLVVSTFIWMHIVTVMKYFKKEKKEADIIQNNKIAENDGNT